ncbi:SpaA isopeptide-forming pilin-related protein [Ruminococcus sp.]|uniref:SpaA isopeptide-forming pilin-related protein n=1 Tax=Ruminococcus sp. TaxID=41978 RepID=UPI0025F2D9AA|nr:SpaA isopeptide-forming pilin-related protein [Ruminococcus sp.]MCR4638370.1 isopeptide-forming domain-containing fimbrial protein [Ruminococcus sp.]
MKKMIKKTSALAISAFMLAQYVPFSAVARDSDKNDLFIHPYILDQNDYDTAEGQKASKPPTGKTADEGNVPSGNSVDTNMKFDIIQVDSDGSAYTGSGTAVSLTDVSAVAATASGSSQASATNLPNGYYKITPADKTDTDARFRDAEAFIIQLPVPDGVGVNRDVHIYPKYTNNNDNDSGTTDPGQETPKSGDKHNVTLTKTEAGSSPTVYVSNAKYKLYYKDATNKWVAGSATYTTNESGQIVVTGLPLGDYYFVEQTPVPTGYLLDQTPLGFTINGSTAATVNATNDKELKVSKNIAKDGAGTAYNWKIEADVPSKASNLISYSVTDTYTYLSGVSVSKVSVTDGTTITDLTSGTDYSVVSGTGTVKVTIDDLSELTGKTKVIIDITSAQNTDSTHTTATNSASIRYEYAYDPDDTNPTPNIPDIPDPDDPGSTYPTPITYPTPGGTEPDPDDPTSPKDQVTPGTFTISNVNGNSELGGASYEVRDMTGNTVYASPVDSTSEPYIATVSNLAPGYYKIYQVGVDPDHLLNDVPITIYVGKDGNIYDSDTATAPISNTVTGQNSDNPIANRVKFVNEPKSTSFNLPFTGTTATIVFSITGILLMAGTAFFIFIILKKRDDDEEEQENN